MIAIGRGVTTATDNLDNRRARAARRLVTPVASRAARRVVSVLGAPLMAWRRGDRWVAGLWIRGRRVTRTFETKSLAESAEQSNRLDCERVLAGVVTWDQLQRANERVPSASELVEEIVLGMSIAEAKELRSRARRLFGDLYDVSLSSVRGRTIEDALESVAADGVTGRTWNGYLGAVKRIYRVALDRRLVESSPVVHLRMKRVPLSGEGVILKRAMARDEFRTLIADDLVRESGRRLVYLVRFLTGIRATELRRLQVRDLKTVDDLAYLELDASKTKTGEPRLLPLPGAVASELLQRRAAWREQTAALFPSTPTRRTFESDLERCGVGGKDGRGRRVLPGSIRLTFDVWLDELGVSLLDQMLLTGRTGRRASTLGSLADEIALSGEGRSAALSVHTYQDRPFALPRLAGHVDRLWSWLLSREVKKSEGAL